jgi:hypothetical protein
MIEGLLYRATLTSYREFSAGPHAAGIAPGHAARTRPGAAAAARSAAIRAFMIFSAFAVG